MTIYELTDEYKQLLMMAEDGDVEPDIFQDTLEAMDGELEDKADGYAKVISQINADIAGVDSEIKRLQGRKKAMENNTRAMKEALQWMMEQTDKKKFKTGLFSFGIQKNPPAVVIDDESRVAHDYLIPQPPKVDKKAIKGALDEGFSFDWCHIEQSESLRIR